jgi:hypothetical protein
MKQLTFIAIVLLVLTLLTACGIPSWRSAPHLTDLPVKNGRAAMARNLNVGRWPPLTPNGQTTPIVPEPLGRLR